MIVTESGTVSDSLSRNQKGSVWKRVNMIGLTALLGKSFLQDPSLASGNLDFGRGLNTFNQCEWSTVPKWFVKQCDLWWIPTFLLGVGKFGACRAEGACLLYQSLIRTLDIESLNCSGKHFQHVVTTRPIRHQWEWLLKACTWSSLAFSPYPLFLCSFCFISFLCNKSQP